MLDRNLIKETANFYCGDSKGLERKRGLRTFRNALCTRIDKGEIKPNQIHWGQLFDTLCNYLGSELYEKTQGPLMSREQASDSDIISALTASEFPFITNKLIHDTLIPAYNENLGIIEFLVTEDDSDRKTVDIAGTMGSEEPERLLEGEEYELTTDSEKTVQIRTHKYGRRLAVTREHVTFDKTGGAILRRAREVGGEMARHRLTWIIQGVQDLAITATGQAVNTMFKYNGTEYAIYQNSHTAIDGQANDNLIVDSFSTIGLNAARTALRQMTNTYGKKLRLEAPSLLLPEALWVQGAKMVRDTTDPDQANPNVSNVFKGRLTNLLTDPLLDDTSATAWYYGDFARQFLWLWIWRPGVDAIPGDPRRDIIMEFKYGYYAGFGAQHYPLVIKSDGTV